METIFICTSCKRRYTGKGAPTLCPCGFPLEVMYNWGSETPVRETLFFDRQSLWRYLPILPTVSKKHIITLNEGWTPLKHVELSFEVKLYFKDETENPTGSFKDRGMTMAISKASGYGLKEVCLPSAGNAGVAASAYCKEAGIGCHVYLPETIPPAFIRETERYGAMVRLAGETFSATGAILKKERKSDWFDLSTLKEPFRVEGKKTLGYEIAEQLGWHFPDVIVYPTGGGTGLIGMWKAFNEMKELNWVKDKLPRMVAVQSNGCAPVVAAFMEESDVCFPWDRGKTVALGLNAPNPIGGSWMLRVLRDSYGTAVMVDEEQIPAAYEEVALLSGTDPSPEVLVAWLGFKKLMESGWIRRGETVIMPVTGSGRRYVM